MKGGICVGIIGLQRMRTGDIQGRLCVDTEYGFRLNGEVNDIRDTVWYLQEPCNMPNFCKLLVRLHFPLIDLVGVHWGISHKAEAV